eukprot:scaffold2157_cov136-Skeletonema_dohrnii-CCMP3373.AAC.1
METYGCFSSHSTLHYHTHEDDVGDTIIPIEHYTAKSSSVPPLLSILLLCKQCMGFASSCTIISIKRHHETSISQNIDKMFTHE